MDKSRSGRMGYGGGGEREGPFVYMNKEDSVVIYMV